MQGYGFESSRRPSNPKPSTLDEPRWLLAAWTTFEVLGLWLVGCVLIAACIGLGYALFELLTWL